MKKYKKYYESSNSNNITSSKPKPLEKISNINKNITSNNKIYNQISDKEGLDKAYQQPNKIYLNNKTMYIAGTSSLQDVYDDLKIPLRLTKYSQRYYDADKILKNRNNNIENIVAHSLGSSVGLELNKNYHNKFKTRVYSSPVFDLFKNNSVNDKNMRFKTSGDLISMFDKNAITINKNSLNPLSLHSYGNYGDTGKQLGKQII